MKRIFPVAMLLLVLSAATANAADAPPPYDCAQSYEYLDQFRQRARGIEVKPGSGVNFFGLGKWVTGFYDIDFDARANDLEKRFPDQFGFAHDVMALSMQAVHGIDPLIDESVAAPMLVMGPPEGVYELQRKFFADARACDIAYKYSPVLGEAPSPAEIVAKFKERYARQDAEKQARLDALDDTQCSVRFVLMENLLPANDAGRQLMNDRFVFAATKVQASQPNFDPEQFKTVLQRQMMERAEKLKSGSYKTSELIEELHHCEIRYGMPMSTINAN